MSLLWCSSGGNRAEEFTKHNSQRGSLSGRCLGSGVFNVLKLRRGADWAWVAWGVEQNKQR